MGCTHTKEGRNSSNPTHSKKSRRKEKSERTLHAEPTYHIKTEDYKQNPQLQQPPLPQEQPSHGGSISRDNTVTLSSNKDENLDEGIDGRERSDESSASPTQQQAQSNQQQQQPQPQPQPQQTQQPFEHPTTLERKGSIVRNGVYYSESELSEENPWQPKYWTPDRIGKWVEDTEFPEGMKYHDVCKIVVQNNMTVPRPRATPHHQSPANITQSHKDRVT